MVYSQIGEGDLLVSNESQIGGCRAGKIITNGPWHASSPKDYENVIPKLTELLSSSPNSPMFSTDWFAPKQRHFYHVDGEVPVSDNIHQVLNVCAAYAVTDKIYLGSLTKILRDNVVEAVVEVAEAGSLVEADGIRGCLGVAVEFTGG